MCVVWGVAIVLLRFS